jgi:hypothetical protein
VSVPGAQADATDPPDAPGPPATDPAGSTGALGADAARPAVRGDRWAPFRVPAHVLARIDLGLRISGGVLAVVAALLSGLLELFFVPLRAGSILLGLAALAAVPINVGIAWFAVHTVGRRWALGPPWAAWTLLMFFAASVRSTEGDYLVAGDNWAALVLILLGSLAFAVYAYRLILRGPLPR